MDFIPERWVHCPRCGAPTQHTKAFNGGESEFWLECSSCNTYINTYEPQPHQSAVHEDPYKYIGNFGGYGSGKTLTSREEILKHIFLTPNANILIGANVASQYEQTIKRELEADIPAAFVSDYSVQKAYMDLINGARIMYRPLDDPDKLRSYNLTMFIIIEGSEVHPDSFSVLRTRLRNMRAMTIDPQTKQVIADWRKGIVESNPGAGWIRTEMLFHADKITNHGNAIDKYYIPPSEKNPAISAHVVSTDANKFLPPTFISEMSRNRPNWWVARYIYSSFSYAEGLVYPGVDKIIVPTAQVPQEWRRILAFDYGLSDVAAFLWGAIDPTRRKIVFYKERRSKDRSVEQLADVFKEGSADIPIGGWLMTPLIDGRSGLKRDYNKRTLLDLFQEQGILFQPAQMNVDARVFRTNTYIESGKIEIMECCDGLIKELRDYKFAKGSGAEGERSDKPEDKNNHSINALEWILMELPEDPSRIMQGIFNKYGIDITRPRDSAQSDLPFALRDDEEDPSYADDLYGFNMRNF